MHGGKDDNVGMLHLCGDAVRAQRARMTMDHTKWRFEGQGAQQAATQQRCHRPAGHLCIQQGVHDGRGWDAGPRATSSPHAPVASICHTAQQQGQGVLCAMCLWVRASTSPWTPVHARVSDTRVMREPPPTPAHHTSTQKLRSTPHTQLTHKLCVPLTRTHTPSTVPLLVARARHTSSTGSPSQRSRLGERGVGGAAAAGKKYLKFTSFFTNNKLYHPQISQRAGIPERGAEKTTDSHPRPARVVFV